MRRDLWNGQSKVTDELHDAPPFTLIPGIACLLPKKLAEQEHYKLGKSFPEGGSAIIFLGKGPVWLIRHGFKTASKYSPNVV